MELVLTNTLLLIFLQKRTIKEILNVCVQIALENLQDVNVKIAELGGEQLGSKKSILTPILVDIFEDIPTVQVFSI